MTVDGRVASLALLASLVSREGYANEMVKNAIKVYARLKPLKNRKNIVVRT